MPSPAGLETPFHALQRLMGNPAPQITPTPKPWNQPSFLDQFVPHSPPRQMGKPQGSWYHAFDAPVSVRTTDLDGVLPQQPASPKTLLPIAPGGPFLHYRDYVSYSHQGSLHVPTYHGDGSFAGDMPVEKAQDLVGRHWGPGYANVPVMGMNDEEERVRDAYTNNGQFPTAEARAANKAAQARALTQGQKDAAFGTGALITGSVSRLADAAAGMTGRVLAGAANPPETYGLFSGAGKMALGLSPAGGGKLLADGLRAASDSALQGNTRALEEFGSQFSPIKGGQLDPIGAISALQMLLTHKASANPMQEEAIVRSLMKEQSFTREQALGALSQAKWDLAKSGAAASGSASEFGAGGLRPPAREGPSPGLGETAPLAKTPSESRGLSNSELPFLAKHPKLADLAEVAEGRLDRSALRDLWQVDPADTKPVYNYLRTVRKYAQGYPQIYYKSLYSQGKKLEIPNSLTRMLLDEAKQGRLEAGLDPTQRAMSLDNLNGILQNTHWIPGGPAWVHHLFVQELEYEFARRGINIHSPEYLIDIDPEAHRIVHGKGLGEEGGLNYMWKQWFKDSPEATRADILRQNEVFRRHFGY